MPTRIWKSSASPSSSRDRETVIEMVAYRIESLVRSGDLRRGSRLPSEPQLAKILNVSRASLREALKGLVFLGLLKARTGDGTYLQPSLTSMASRHLQWMLLLQEIKYLELYELRELLEPAAAAMAARRATHDDLEQMRSALAGMKSSVDDPTLFIRHELDFHNAITSASKNGALQSTMQMMYGALSEGRHRVLPLVHDLAEHCARHERIFRLISGGDATGARRAIISDVRYAESLLRRNFKDSEQGDPIRRSTNTGTMPGNTSATPRPAKVAAKSARKPAAKKTRKKKKALGGSNE
jgi:GntR family transcriptional repressor for pyruvate dehydrogenase complex